MSNATEAQQGAEYRPDIDGLRALAVMAVVFYHVGLGPVSGGFVGVDIFFVISGYLITSIILRERRGERFSLLRFYARRIRRIYPMLLLVIVATLAAGWLLLLPLDYLGLGQQSAAAAFGVSNFYFLAHSGYFDAAANYMPLLHTWSLGVEEQFYLLWPALFLVVWRVGKGTIGYVVAAIAALAVISFIICVSQLANGDVAAFYSPQARAFELAVGALVAFAPRLRHRVFVELFPVLGLALMAVPAVLFSDETRFPGVAALVPCIGAMLVVWPASRPAVATRLLAFRPLVVLGLLSYSIYLWHWPLLVFLRHYQYGQGASDAQAWQIIAVTLILSAASYVLVERRFRRPAVRTRKALAVGVGAMATVAVAGLGIAMANGVPGRLASPAQQYAAYQEQDADDGRPVQNCFARLAAGSERLLDCLDLSSGLPHVLVLGDSLAGHYMRALGEAFPDVQLLRLTSSGCSPVLHPSPGPENYAACRRGTPLIFEQVVPAIHFDAIILSARWQVGDYDQIRATVDYLQLYADRVIVFGQTLEYHLGLPQILAGNALLREDIEIADFLKYDDMEIVDQAMRRLLAGSAAEYYSPLDVICPAGAASCRQLTATGVPIEADWGHFTADGARDVVAAFQAAGLRL